MNEFSEPKKTRLSKVVRLAKLIKRGSITFPEIINLCTFFHKQIMSGWGLFCQMSVFRQRSSSDNAVMSVWFITWKWSKVILLQLLIPQRDWTINQPPHKRHRHYQNKISTKWYELSYQHRHTQSESVVVSWFLKTNDSIDRVSSKIAVTQMIGRPRSLSLRRYLIVLQIDINSSRAITICLLLLFVCCNNTVNWEPFVQME